MPKTPRSDDNAQGSSDEEDSDSSGSNSDVSSQDDSSDVSDLVQGDIHISEVYKLIYR